MILAFVLWVLIGIGVGALVRNQVGAIVGVLVFTQFLEPVGRAAAAFVDGLVGRHAVPPRRRERCPRRRERLHWHGDAAAARRGDPLEWWAGGLVLLGYAVVLLVLGHLFELAPRRQLTADQVATDQVAGAGVGLRGRGFFAGAGVTGIVPVSAMSTTSAGSRRVDVEAQRLHESEAVAGGQDDALELGVTLEVDHDARAVAADDREVVAAGGLPACPSRRCRAGACRGSGRRAATSTRRP